MQWTGMKCEKILKNAKENVTGGNSWEEKKHEWVYIEKKEKEKKKKEISDKRVE